MNPHTRSSITPQARGASKIATDDLGAAAGTQRQDDLGCRDFARMPMADIRAALKAQRDPAALALKTRLAEVAHRYAKRRRARPVPFAALRMRDLEIIFLDRYGGPLPDDDAGLGDARVAIHHLANLQGN
jgi:hypothetical protein